ncbi:hypothetical protein DL96DRAFT_1580834 [Flagelloscypha sp. PMI_526]|nr:hypothetical protein DL96DRAFT_1580834 [Flagelloscypha sp. PMI_526]
MSHSEFEIETITSSVYITSDTSTITYDHEQGVGRTLYGFMRSAGDLVEAFIDRLRRPQFFLQPKVRGVRDAQGFQRIDEDPPSSWLTQTRFGELHPQPTTEDGKRILFNVKALYDITPRSPNDLQCEKGDIISVTHVFMNGRCRGELVDRSKRRPGSHFFRRCAVLFPPELTRPPTPDDKECQSLTSQPRAHDGSIRLTSGGNPILFYVVAVSKYPTTAEFFLDIIIEVGDIIAVTETWADNWWTGELVGKPYGGEGKFIFSSKHVQLCPPPPAWPCPSLWRDNIRAGSEQFKALSSNSVWRRKQRHGLSLTLEKEAGSKLICFHVTALGDYEAKKEEELGLKEGDAVIVTTTFENGWWHGELVSSDPNRRLKGIFPSNIVRMNCAEGKSERIHCEIPSITPDVPLPPPSGLGLGTEQQHNASL